VLTRIARFCYERRRLVLTLWVVVLIGFIAAGRAFGADSVDNFSLPGAGSQRAFDLLSERFPQEAGDTATVVVEASGGVDAPAARQGLDDLLARIEKIDHVVGTDSPFAPGAERQISQDGTIAYATVHFDERASEVPLSVAKDVVNTVDDAKASGAQFEVTGAVVAAAVQEPPGASEGIGIIAAIIILLIAFGSLLAMGLPIVTALFGIGIGISIVELLGHLLDVPSFAPQVATMIGIGVGIDYALFIVTRYRSALHDGASPREATHVALSTAGRAVMFAGSVVVVALLGLFIMNFAIVRGVSLAASATVLVTMLAAITLLPAFLGFSGRNIDKWKLKWFHRHETGSRDTVAYRWSRQVQRRPWPMAIVGAIVLIVLAMPLFAMRLGSSDQGNDPTSLTTRRGYDLLAKGFGPGFNGPLLVVTDLRGANDPNVLTRLSDALQRDPTVQAVAPPRFNEARDTAVMVVVPKTAPQDKRTDQLVHRVRDDVVPAVTGTSDVQVYVGGITAAFTDFADRIGQRLPLFVGVVILLSFLLLMVVFRSVLVALKAAIMNLLSIGAAYGVIVAVFQWGWLGGLFGVDHGGPIEAWVPMMMFAVLFGLSMDYEVFLLSRIREEYTRTHNNAEAVADGLAMTARVITAAAAIMIAVFGSFVLGDQRVLKLLGLGLSVAVLLDATIVRMVLVPATMELLGDANWWLPRWLERHLPDLHVEGDATRPAPAERELAPVGGD
jgi:RND superfamily putative drug exporter